jgi:hypothetical protein
VEKALKDVKSEGVSQDEWVDEAIIKLVEAELLERFNQDDFRRFAREQLGPPIMERGDDRDVVKEVDYVEVRRRREGEFGRVQVGGR